MPLSLGQCTKRELFVRAQRGSSRALSVIRKLFSCFTPVKDGQENHEEPDLRIPEETDRLRAEDQRRFAIPGYREALLDAAKNGA